MFILAGGVVSPKPLMLFGFELSFDAIVVEQNLKFKFY